MEGNSLTESSRLLALVPYVGALVTVASDPVSFFRGPFLRLALEYVFLRPAAWGLSHLIAAYETIAGIIAGLGPILTDPFVWTGDLLVGIVEGLYGMLYGLADTSGYAAPIATVGTVVILAVLVLAVTYALVSLLPTSNAVESLQRWRP